jgi:hypothetical protein
MNKPVPTTKIPTPKTGKKIAQGSNYTPVNKNSNPNNKSLEEASKNRSNSPRIFLINSIAKSKKSSKTI